MPTLLRTIERIPAEPEQVDISIRYRVGSILYDKLNRAVEQADLVKGDVQRLTIRTTSSTVYRSRTRAEGRGR